MTSISGEKYLLRTEKMATKTANHYLALTFMGFCVIFFFFKDCICQQHIARSTGAGGFLNKLVCS